MASLNKVMLIGRLTDNPEPPRTLPNSGSTVVKFRFAVGRSKKNPQTGQWENDPNPLYIDCEAFGRPDNTRLTDLITQYCVKGKELFIEGRLQYDTWEDKNTPGQKRSKHKIVIDNIQFLGSREGGGGGGGGYGGGDEMDAPARSNTGGGNYGGRGPAPATRGPGPRPSTPPDDDGGGGGYEDPEKIPF